MVPPEIAEAYDAERFRAEGHKVVDMLADALARWHRREGAVLPWQAPDAARQAWAEIGRGELIDGLSRAVAASTALHHPRYLGHQVPPPLPAAALAELVSALLNQGTGVFEMGPAAAPIELAVVDWMCRAMGYGPGAGGALTSGGSLGNLTALLAMRQARAGHDAWKEGAGKPLAVITSTDAHYSVARAIRVMGWGDAGIISVPVDAQHRLRASAIEAALDARVIGIVAAAGSTATGAYDPLEEIADLAHARGLWLHVDAAHGGGAILSERHKGKLAGIERADSIVWDAHKLMMMPALVTGVLFKQGSHTYEAFAQQASYLFAGGAPAETWWDLGQRTLECTKRMMAVEVWSALRVQGEAWFGQVVDRVCELAALLAGKIEASGDFELAIAPESNIVCFRHKTADNRALRKKAIEGGKFYLVGTELDGSYHLRTTIMNPLTEPADLDELLVYLRCLV